jgi:hypothetical protein
VAEGGAHRRGAPNPFTFRQSGKWGGRRARRAPAVKLVSRSWMGGTKVERIGDMNGRGGWSNPLGRGGRPGAAECEALEPPAPQRSRRARGTAAVLPQSPPQSSPKFADRRWLPPLGRVRNVPHPGGGSSLRSSAGLAMNRETRPPADETLTFGGLFIQEPLPELTVPWHLSQ